MAPPQHTLPSIVTSFDDDVAGSCECSPSKSPTQKSRRLGGSDQKSPNAPISFLAVAHMVDKKYRCPQSSQTLQHTRQMLSSKSTPALLKLIETQARLQSLTSQSSKTPSRDAPTEDTKSETTSTPSAFLASSTREGSHKRLKPCTGNRQTCVPGANDDWAHSTSQTLQHRCFSNASSSYSKHDLNVSTDAAASTQTSSLPRLHRQLSRSATTSSLQAGPRSCMLQTWKSRLDQLSGKARSKFLAELLQERSEHTAALSEPSEPSDSSDSDSEDGVRSPFYTIGPTKGAAKPLMTRSLQSRLMSGKWALPVSHSRELRRRRREWNGMNTLQQWTRWCEQTTDIGVFTRTAAWQGSNGKDDIELLEARMNKEREQVRKMITQGVHRTKAGVKIVAHHLKDTEDEDVSRYRNESLDRVTKQTRRIKQALSDSVRHRKDLENCVQALKDCTEKQKPLQVVADFKDIFTSSKFAEKKNLPPPNRRESVKTRRQSIVPT